MTEKLSSVPSISRSPATSDKAFYSTKIGRIGSVVGPVIGGHLIGLQWTNSALFLAAAVPVVVSALAIVRLYFVGRQSVGRQALA